MPLRFREIRGRDAPGTGTMSPGLPAPDQHQMMVRGFPVGVVACSWREAGCSDLLLPRCYAVDSIAFWG